MKTLVQVSGMGEVPDKLRSSIHVVSANSWMEAAQFLQGQKRDVAMFWGDEVPTERLLKAVESYVGNLLVYSVADCGPTMRSRFTRVLRGRQPVVWKELGKPSDLEVLLEKVKKEVL